MAPQTHPSTSASSAFVASSTRLNTHILLGLSLLVLSANARPLDTSGAAGNTGFAGLLNGNAAGWVTSGKGGIGEQIAESLLKMLHLNGGNTEQKADETMLNDIVRPALPSAEYPVLMTGSPPTVDSATTADMADDQENMHILETLLHQNPALSFVMGVTDLAHKMRELFVDIAVLEGEERGIFVGERTTPEPRDIEGDSVLDLLLDKGYAGEQATSNGLGLQLQSEDQRMPVFPSVSVEEDPPIFELDDVSDTNDLVVPGQFTPTIKAVSLDSSTRPQEAAFTHLNPFVNPYVALALSSVLATLFVVSVVVGRHHYLTSRTDGGERNTEDELERGEATSRESLDGGEEEKPTLTQPSTGSGGQSAIEKKTAMGLESHPVSPELNTSSQSSTGCSDAPAMELDEKAAMELQANASTTHSEPPSEQVEAKEAMALLIDVANAALASTACATMGSNTARTPKAVSSALDTIRLEVARTPQTRHLQFLAPRSRPGTPSTPPRRPKSALGPSVVVSPVPHGSVSIGEGINMGNGVVVEDNDMTNTSRPASPQSNASSFVSACSHMPGGALSIGRAAGRNIGRTTLGSAFVPQQGLSIPRASRAVSPAPSLLGVGGASPTLSTISYSTAIEAPLTPVRRDREGQTTNATFHTPPTRPTSPGDYPQHPGALSFHGEHAQDYGEYGAIDEAETAPMAPGAFGRVQMRPAMLPPAQLTQTALELALMLPATEWIFQFIVVFIGWFGFWMRPVGAAPRAPTREPSRG